MKNRENIENLKRESTDCEVCEGLGDNGFYVCPKCGREVFDFRYSFNLRKMEAKYGTDDFLELSRKKLTFSEIVTIYSFIERCDRHCGDTLTSDECREDGTFLNLGKRLKEIEEELG